MRKGGRRRAILTESAGGFTAEAEAVSDVEVGICGEGKSMATHLYLRLNDHGFAMTHQQVGAMLTAILELYRQHPHVRPPLGQPPFAP